MKPYYEDGTITVHAARCEDLTASLPADSVDLIVTDPPYFKVKNEPWDRQWDTPAVFLQWLDGILAGFYRVLKPNGSLYLFASPQMSARVECLVAERFNVLNNIRWVKDAGWQLKSDKDTLRRFFPSSESIIFAEHKGADGVAKGESGWGAKCDELRGFVFEPLRAYLANERDRAGLSTADVAEAWRIRTGNTNRTGMAGHWFERVQWSLPTRENYDWLREILNVSVNGRGPVLRREYEVLRREYEVLRREYEDLRRPFNATPDVPYTDVWTFPTVGQYPGKHPCEKPLAMMEHIIRCSSRPDAFVFDPFCGSGNVGRAAKNLVRRVIMGDMSEQWAREAASRCTQEVLAL